jgi:hypothetical protein
MGFLQKPDCDKLEQLDWNRLRRIFVINSEIPQAQEDFMEIILVLIMPIIGLSLTVIIMRFYIERGKLNARLFATIFSLGFSSSIFFFFVSPFIVNGATMNIGNIGLGLGIACLNFLMTFPISYYMYRHILKK